MEMRIYSIRDSKAEVYNTPFVNRTHGEAERNFQTLATDPKSSIFPFPEDYDLFYLGSFDDQTGKLTCLQTPEHMIKATHVQKRATITPDQIQRAKQQMDKHVTQ